MTVTDEHLAALAALGDRSAMEELATRFHPMLRKYYLKLARHPEDAQDLTQTAMLRTIEKIHQFRQGNKFAPWLFKLAYHIFVDEMRRRRPMIVEDQVIENISGGIDEHARSDDRNQAERLLETLSEELRSMVILRYYMDLGYGEIAAVMGCSEKKVKWRLHDAMERLRKEAGA